MKTKLYVHFAGLYLATIAAGLGQPTITTQPQNQTNVIGTTATFTVAAAGLEPMFYQWQYASDLVNFVDRPQDTDSALTITNVQPVAAGGYRVIITNATGAATSEVANLVVVSPPTLAFAAATYSVSEGAGSVTLPVRRSGYPLPAVTVDYATTDGTATNGIKYIAVSGTLTFGPGETNKSIVVPILDEGFVDIPRNFRVVLSNPGSGVLLGLATTTVSILDDDRPIQLGASSYYVSEEAGLVQVEVLRCDDGDYPVRVDFITSNGSALAGLDYLGMTNTLTLAPGEARRIVPITIVNDAIREGSEYFRVTIANPTGGGVIGSIMTSMVTITDSDEVFQLEFSNYYPGEGTEFVRIGVVHGESDNSSTVDIRTVDGTAKAGTDYSALTNTLSFAPGETLKLIDIPIIKDGLKEADETFSLTLSNPGGSNVLGAIRTATVTIRDNDPGVQFTPNVLWVWQQDGQAMLTLTRGNDQLLDSFTVDYVTQNRTAIAGRDYVAATGTVAFAAGEMTRTLPFTLLDNGVPMQDRKFAVQLSNPTGGMVLGAASNLLATVTICDVREMLPHRMAALRFSADGKTTLTVGGGHTPGLGVVNRFLPFIDLYPLEVSSNLFAWTSLATLVRTNAATNVLAFTETTNDQSSQRFYRASARPSCTPNLPPAGPHAIGRADRWLIDPSRRNRFQISTNSSFQIAIWYPATPRAGSVPLPRMDEPILRDNNYWTDFSDRSPLMASYAAGGLEVAPSQAPYPIVLISPGANGPRQDLWEKAEEIASHGYVVAAPDHYDAIVLVLPDGTYEFGGPGKDWSDAGFADRVRDLRFMVDQMEQWNVSDPLFAGRLDPGRVAAIGFSWGGGVAGEFCRVDGRGKAAVVLEGYFQNASALLGTGLTKPVLSVYRSDYSDSRLYNKLIREAIWFQVNNTTHLDIGGFAWWPAGSYQAVRNGWEINQTVNAYLVWFLDKYLKDSTRPMPATQGYTRIFNFKQK